MYDTVLVRINGSKECKRKNIQAFCLIRKEICEQLLQFCNIYFNFTLNTVTSPLALFNLSLFRMRKLLYFKGMGTLLLLLQK